MSGTRGEWNDERLEAAFRVRAHAASRTPAGLVETAVARLEPRPRSRPGGLAWAAAAVGLVVLIGTVAAFGIRPRPSIPPTSASSTPGVSGPAPTTQPSAVADPLGQPLTVSAAMAIRDGAAHPDREIAISGFLSPVPVLACPAILLPLNPTRVDCPASFQWLMERPETLMTVGPGSADGHPPTGPAIHPSFALVDPPDLTLPDQGPVEPVPIVVAGHFHDRRAALCQPDAVAACGQTFVVDRIVEVNGEPQVVATRLDNVRFDDATQKQVTEQPRDLQDDVDRLVLGAAPGAVVESRQLVVIGRVISIEPVLARDDFVPYVGNPATLVWFVTVVDAEDGVPKSRTFALFDGSNWFAEITADGAQMLDRRASGPAPSGTPTVASADPTAFDSAPTTVLGIPVRDIATVMRERQASMDDLGRDEMAIKAWYVSPDPSAPCEPVPAIHPPTPPCDEGRHWLLDRPDQFGREVGQLRTNPEHWPAVLNPLIPVDVPFDVPDSRTGGVIAPQPVVVLGHFIDNRVNTYAGNVYFVVDALGWTRDHPVDPAATLVRLTSSATEDPDDVVARIRAESKAVAVATWMTVVDSDAFAALDPEAAADAPEFTAGSPVWMVRRLIRGEMDGRPRLAIEWSLTADHGSRVWLTETPDSSIDLATTIDIGPIDAHTSLVQVADYGDQVVAVRDVTRRDSLDWRVTVHRIHSGLEVARGSTPNEVAIRWVEGDCYSVWRITVGPGSARIGPGPWILPQTFDNPTFCPEHPVPRAIVLTFAHPVDLDDIRTVDEDPNAIGG